MERLVSFSEKKNIFTSKITVQSKAVDTLLASDTLVCVREYMVICMHAFSSPAYFFLNCVTIFLKFSLSPDFRFNHRIIVV